jgi:hypothetical protein
VHSEQKRDSVAATTMPRRTTDLVEDAAAWILISASVFLLAVALVAGVGAHAQASERLRTEPGERTRVTDTLLATAPLVPAESGFRGSHWFAAVPRPQSIERIQSDPGPVDTHDR